MTLPLHLLYQPGGLNLVTAYNTHQYLEEVHQHLRTTFAFTQQQLQQSTEGRKAYYDRKASHHDLNEATPHSQVKVTQSEIIGNRRLVNTPARTATLTNDQHNTTTHIILPKDMGGAPPNNNNLIGTAAHVDPNLAV